MRTSNKLREALTRVKKIAASYINCHDDEIDRVMTEIVATCDSALAEPVRNCDLYKTKEEAQEAFLKEPCDHPCGNCWVEDINNECGVEWLLAHATEKEGGAK